MDQGGIDNDETVRDIRSLAQRAGLGEVTQANFHEVMSQLSDMAPQAATVVGAVHAWVWMTRMLSDYFANPYVRSFERYPNDFRLLSRTLKEVADSLCAEIGTLTSGQTPRCSSDDDPRADRELSDSSTSLMVAMSLLGRDDATCKRIVQGAIAQLPTLETLLRVYSQPRPV